MPRKPFVLGRKRKSAKKKVATKQYVKNMLNKVQEIKYYDEADTIAISTTGSVVCVSDMAQGDTDITRDGDKIILKSMQLRGTMAYAAADVNNLIRIIVFQWFPVDTAADPSAAAILQQTGTFGIVSPYNHDQRNQFHILADRTFLLNSASYPYKGWKMNIPFKYVKKQATFLAGGVYGANHLHILFISDSSAVSDPSVSFYSRVYYTDS